MSVTVAIEHIRVMTLLMFNVRVFAISS